MWQCDGKKGRTKKASEGIKEEVIMKNEKWKPIAGYEDYEVSSEGRVRSLNYNKTRKVKVLSPGVNNGYLFVYLYKDGKTKKFYIHSLVVTVFKGPIPPGMTIDHINSDKRDNRLENLQLLTRGDNARKGNNKQLDLMLVEYPYTELTFPSSYEASAFFGYNSKETVGAIISQARKRGKNWITLKNKKYLFAQAD